jgi:hypothetical protein
MPPLVVKTTAFNYFALHSTGLRIYLCNAIKLNQAILLFATNNDKMKDILLLAAVSLLMSIGAALPAHRESIAHISLPEVTITAKRLPTSILEINLPTVIIRAAKPEMATLPLPEVVITATRLRKA